MKKTSLYSVTAAALCCCSSVFASTATLTEWGTLANIVSGSCPGNSCSPTDLLISGINSETVVDGSQQLNAATGPVSISSGNAQASASVTGAVAAPILKAEASAAAESWIGAGAFAVQGYEFTGLAGQLLTVDIALDGFITNPDGDESTGFGVGMYLFTPEQIDFATLSSDPANALGTLALAGFALTQEQKIEWSITAQGLVDQSAQLSLFLNPGDQFYLGGGLLASAGGLNAVADAFSTLTATIDPNIANDLQAAGDVNVPIPGALWLFVPAAGALLRKKKGKLQPNSMM